MLKLHAGPGKRRPSLAESRRIAQQFPQRIKHHLLIAALRQPTAGHILGRLIGLNHAARDGLAFFVFPRVHHFQPEGMPGAVLAVLRLRHLPFPAVTLAGHFHGGIERREQRRMPTQAPCGVLARVMHHQHQATGQALQRLRCFEDAAHVSRCVFVGFGCGTVQGVEDDHGTSTSGQHGGAQVCNVLRVGQLERLQHQPQAGRQPPPLGLFPRCHAQPKACLTLQSAIDHWHGLHPVAEPLGTVSNSSGSVQH